MKSIIVLFMSLSFLSFAVDTKADPKVVLLEDGSITSKVFEKEIKSKAERDIQIQNCEAFSIFAKSSFKARQNGVSAAQIFKVISSDSQPAKKIMELIVVDVFNQPLLESSKMIDIASSEYANRFFVECASA